MRCVTTLICGLLVAAAAPNLCAQATGAAQSVKKSADAAAQTSSQSPKPADKAPAKPVAQTTVKSPAPSGAQAKPVTPAPAKPAASAPAAAKPAPTAPAKGTAQAPKAAAPAAKPAAPLNKPAAKTGAKAKKPAAKKAAAKKPAPKKAVGTPTLSAQNAAESRIPRRDPFESLVGREQGGGGPKGPLPVGKAGLQVSTLRLDGVVRAPNGMIAVVSNPQSRTYFLREGDQLYDGRVEKIAMDGVSFHEVGKDAFGKPVERQVNKRIYASAGEQQ